MTYCVGWKECSIHAAYLSYDHILLPTETPVGCVWGGAMVIITEFLSLDIVSCLEMRINMFKQFVGHILTARCESTSSIRLKRVTLVTRSTPERKEKKPNMVYLCFLKTQFWGRLCHC